MKILFWWSVAAVIFLLLFRLAVRGRLINWYGLLLALPGITKDIACQVWIDVSSPFRRRKKEVQLDEYERRLS